MTITVKQMTSDGDVFYWDASSVHVTPPNADDGGTPKTIHFHSGGIPCSIDTGEVYLINSAGKTVDRILLDMPPK